MVSARVNTITINRRRIAFERRVDSISNQAISNCRRKSSTNIFPSCAPYFEVVEEMTVKEFLEFHSQFQPLLSSISIDNIIALVGLEKQSINRSVIIHPA
jgi:hypothetical protein